MVRVLLMDPTVNLLLLLMFGLVALVVIVLCLALMATLRLLSGRPLLRPAFSTPRATKNVPEEAAAATPLSVQPPPGQRFAGGPPRSTVRHPAESGGALAIDARTGDSRVVDTSAALEDQWQDSPIYNRDAS